MCASSNVDFGVEFDVCGKCGVFEEAECTTTGSPLMAGREPVSATRFGINLEVSANLSKDYDG